MGTQKDESDFEIDVNEDSELEKDAPQGRARAVTSPHPTAPVGNDELAPGGTPAEAVEAQPEMPGGQMAYFRFVDGVTLEIHMRGVAEHDKPWFVLRGADRIVMNEGPLLGVA